MNTGGDAAEQVVRLSLEAGEVAIKITGQGAKELAALLITILKEDNKTKGKAKLETMLRSGSPLNIFSIPEKDRKKFEQEAKSYGIMYYPIPSEHGKKDGMMDFMVREEDSARINRLVERFKFASVAETAKIKTEITKSREEQEKSQSPFGVKTEKSPLSENLSRNEERAAEGTSKNTGNVITKPSIREELRKIQDTRKKDEAPPRKEEPAKQKKPEKSVQHKQPKKKRKKQKER